MQTEEEKSPEDGQGAQEQDEEEKKKREIMKKYYRNRYSSFLEALKNKKTEEAKEAEELKAKQERKKQKLKEKVLQGLSKPANQDQDKALSDGEADNSYSDDETKSTSAF